MAEEQQTIWQLGDFAMLRSGCVARLKEETSPGRFGVELVTNYENGIGVCCGGFVFSYGSAELAPVTDVEALILCSAYAAMKKIEVAKVEIQTQEKVMAANVAALDAFRRARAAIAKATGAA